MAFGKRFDINWTTPTADCRLWIKQAGYTGVSTSLDPAPTPISIRWGEQGRDDLTSPLRISTARIRFMGDAGGEMVEEIFDGGDTEYLVKFWRDPQRDGSYELEWEGYLATDLWRDNPHLPAEVIELEAIDGLALLENRQAFTAVGTNEPWEHYRLSRVLRRVLAGWDPNLDSPTDAAMHDLPITTSQNWRPNGLGLTDPATDQPFDDLDIYNPAFQELNDTEFGSEEVEGTLDQRTQLEGILERFGLTLMLSGGKWHLRQRDQIDDGTSLKTWTMPAGDTFFSSSETTDVTTSLPAAARTEKPRSRASRLQRLKSSYSYDDLGQLVINEGFEEPLSTGWTVFGTAGRKKYSNSSIVSQSGQYFLNMGNGSFSQPDGQEGSFVKQDVPARLYQAGPGSALDVQWDILLNDSGVGYGNSETRIKLGNYYVQARRWEISAEVDPGLDVKIPLKSSLPGGDGTVIIPKGTQLRTGDASSDVNVNSITLTEPGRGGDDVLVGDVDVGSSIKQGDFVLFYVWSDTTTTSFEGTREHWGLLHDVLDYPTKLDSHNSFNPQSLRMPLHTPLGVDLVDEDLSIAFWCDDSSSSSIDWNVVVDNISIQLLVGGEAIEETRYIADSGEYGREQTISHRIGDGPTAKHPRGIFDVGGQQIFTDWGYEAGQGETGKLLEQLLVEQWMRQQRDTLDRRTYQCELRGSNSLKPHHVVGFDSKTYTVSYLERRYGTSGDSGRVELTELKDAGIAGLTRAFSMETEPESGGGSGGGSTVINSGNQTIEGATDWGGLADKPSSLFAANGDTDGYAETQALANADVTGALDLSGSTFLETSGDNLIARVKDEDSFESDSDTHLATQQSIKKYIQSASGALYLLDDVDLGATDQGVQAGDLLAHNGSIWTDRDPSDIKVGNADKLDGYEAAAFPRKAEDATISGQWTYSERLTLGSELRTEGAATGFAGSGTIVGDQESWFDDVQIRGTLFAREFEVKKLDVSRGEHIFGPGGGKVKEVVSQDGSTATLDFEENPGIKAGDYCLIKETSATGGAIAIEIRLEATSSGSTVDFNVLNSGSGTYRSVEPGDDVVVVASSNSGRDSMVYVNPYGPYIDALDGLSSFSDWDNRSPGARFGEVGGMPSIGGQSPTGSGLWANNAYVKGTIVANQGAIADSVTIGSTSAQDLASESFVTTKASEAETNAISYADGIDSSVRTNLNSIFDNAVANGDTVIEGGVIATDLVTLDSVAFSPVESDSVIASINSSSEGIAINAAKLDITSGDLNITAGDLEIGAATTFLSQEYDPTSKAPAADAGTMRQTSEPSARPSGEPLQKGDMWLDTSDGDKPYTWDGNSWEQAYTAIDGGDINTGTVNANRLSFTDGQGRISGDNLLIDASTTFSSPSIPDGALSEDYTAEGAESQSIRKDSPPGNGDVDGRGLRVGDVWVDTSDGDRPHSWDGNSWTKAYTSIKGGDIDTGSLYAVDATITSTLTMGNADTNGVITNPNEDFRVDKTGFTVSTASGFILENAYTIEDTDSALFPAFSLYGEKDNQNIRMVSRHDWTLDISSDDALEMSADKNVNIVSNRGRITMLPDADKLSYGVGGLEIVSIPNSMTADNDNSLLDRGVGIKFEPFESDGSGNANKSDLEEVMGPNEAMLYAIRYKDDNIDLAWAETDSNGNIQNRSNTF